MMKYWLNTLKNISLKTKIALLATGVCILISVILLFIPKVVGVADDGTGIEILNTVGLTYIGDNTADTGYLTEKYEWEITLESSEWNLQTILVYLLKNISYWITGNRLFEIRYLAMVYIILYIPAVFLLIKTALSRTERKGSMILVAIIAVFIFADAGYIAYFNSLYPEALIFILFLYMTGAMLNLHYGEKNEIWPLALLVLSGAAMCFVRRYCFVAGLICAIICFLQIRRKKHSRWNMTVSIISVVLVMASVGSFFLLKSDFDTADKMHSMTRGVLLQSENPEKTLENFGIDQSYSLLTDVSAYDNYPLTDGFAKILENGFYDKYTFLDILKYYIMHPDDMFSMMNIAVKTNIDIQRENCGSFTENSGRAAGSRTVFFSTYSFLKNRSFPKTIGYFVVLFICCIVLGGEGISLLRKKNLQKQIFLQTTVGLIILAFVQTIYIIINSGDVGLVKYNCQLGIVMDILLFFIISEIIDRLNIFKRG